MPHKVPNNAHGYLVSGSNTFTMVSKEGSFAEIYTPSITEPTYEDVSTLLLDPDAFYTMGACSKSNDETVFCPVQHTALQEGAVFAYKIPPSTSLTTTAQFIPITYEFKCSLPHTHPPKHVAAFKTDPSSPITTLYTTDPRENTNIITTWELTTEPENSAATCRKQHEIVPQHNGFPVRLPAVVGMDADDRYIYLALEQQITINGPRDTAEFVRVDKTTHKIEKHHPLSSSAFQFHGGFNTKDITSYKNNGREYFTVLTGHSYIEYVADPILA